MDTHSEEFVQALARASAELGLQDHYRACVKPLFHLPRHQWPMCCGANCEPCAQILVAVADRTLQLIGHGSAE